jgi:hypothetical protein
MRIFLAPIGGLIPLLTLVSVGCTLAALLDACVHGRSAFFAAGKGSKRLWIVLMLFGFYFTIFGLLASIFYFARVRPLVELAGPLRRSKGGEGDDEVYIRGAKRS